VILRVVTRAIHQLLLLAAVAAVRSATAAIQTDCLTPVDPYPGDWHVRYTNELHKRIEPPLHTFAQMLLRPAFEPEYSVSLHGTPDDMRFSDAKKYFLSRYAAEKNIWYSMPENNEQKQQQEVSVAVATVDFPQPLAKRIYTIWHKMLLRTRYSETEYLATDATMAEFSSEGLYAETLDPAPCKSAALLIELGERLSDYCKAPPEKRELAAKSIQVQAAALEVFIKRQHSK
jgi:hypothetical protein